VAGDSILVVDDNDMNLRLLRWLLEKICACSRSRATSSRRILDQRGPTVRTQRPAAHREHLQPGGPRRPAGGDRP
jgi:CheY-like chemotaxis protein